MSCWVVFSGPEANASDYLKHAMSDISSLFFPRLCLERACVPILGHVIQCFNGMPILRWATVGISTQCRDVKQSFGIGMEGLLVLGTRSAGIASLIL